MTVAPYIPQCNRKCGSTVPHSSHLFLGSGQDLKQFALRSEKEGATVFLPNGQLIWRSAPGAIHKLKVDVRHWMANEA